MKQRKQSIESACGRFFFDEEAADRVVEWIETYCTHTDGDQMGEPLLLEPFQKEILRTAFGWKQKSNGYRRYTRIYVEIPRGNGKSALGSAIGLYLLIGDREGAAEVYSCAGSKDQARKVFQPAKIMAENHPVLGEILKIQAQSLVDFESFSTFQVVSADGKLQHGHKSHGIIFDELHVQPNDELYEAFRTSMAKRKQPMLWIFTTAGLAGTFAEEIHDYAVNVRDGVFEDDGFLPFIFAADKDEDRKSVV